MNYQTILINLLERLNYKGINISFPWTDLPSKEKLHYGMVIKYDENPNHKNMIICSDDNKKFGYIDIRKHDIRKALNKINKDFYFLYIGFNKETYINQLNKTDEYLHFIQDIQSYNKFLYDPNSICNLTIKELIKELIKRIKNKN